MNPGGIRNRYDTLEFVDDSNLIRKGYFYTYEKYLYRIGGENLYIRLPDASEETQHPILKIESNSVVLGNMYLTMGFADNTGTFYKATENQTLKAKTGDNNY